MHTYKEGQGLTPRACAPPDADMHEPAQTYFWGGSFALQLPLSQVYKHQQIPSPLYPRQFPKDNQVDGKVRSFPFISIYSFNAGQ